MKLMKANLSSAWGKMTNAEKQDVEFCLVIAFIVLILL